MSPKEKQLGFFMTPDGNTLHKSRKTGDTVFHVTENKRKPKPAPAAEKPAMTPFKEVIQFEEARRNNELYGLHIITTLDGDEWHVEVTPEGTRLVDGTGPMDETDTRPASETLIPSEGSRTKFKDLSPKAQKLYYVLKKKGII